VLLFVLQLLNLMQNKISYARKLQVLEYTCLLSSANYDLYTGEQLGRL
jgi:hypothetical protein